MSKRHNVVVTCADARGRAVEWRGVVEATQARATVAKRIAIAFGLTGRTIDRAGYVRVLSNVMSDKPGWGIVEVF